MKILLINTVCGIKSTGNICYDLAEKLSERGHEVKIAYGRGELPIRSEKYAVKICGDFSVFVHAGLARLSDSSGYHSYFETKKFIEWINEYDPDVINLHNLHGYYIHVGLLFDYLRSCGKRIIWTLHDCWPFSGHSALCDADDCEKWKSGCGNCPQTHVYPKSIIDRSKSNWLLKKETFTGISNVTIVTPSFWLAEKVSESFLGEYSIATIHNGIDVDTFRFNPNTEFRKKYNVENKIIVLGVASVWGQKKGFDDFAELSKMIDDRFLIVLVGVENKLQIIDNPKLLTLGPTKSIQELIDIYSASDVFVNLSYCDTYPTVLLEARACGLPIITYDTGGSAEAGGEKAVVIRKGDISECAKELDLLANRIRRGSDVAKGELSPEKIMELGKNSFTSNYVQLIENGPS